MLSQNKPDRISIVFDDRSSSGQCRLLLTDQP